jgi:hypothetical protein
LPRRPSQDRWRLGALRPQRGPSLLLAAPVASSTSSHSVLPLATCAPVAPVARRRKRTLGGSGRVRFFRKLVSAKRLPRRMIPTHSSSRFPISNRRRNNHEISTGRDRPRGGPSDQLHRQRRGKGLAPEGLPHDRGNRVSCRVVGMLPVWAFHPCPRTNKPVVVDADEEGVFKRVRLIQISKIRFSFQILSFRGHSVVPGCDILDGVL